jgi:hypothetical protein
VAARIITVVKKPVPLGRRWQDGKLGSKAGTEKHLIGHRIISTMHESIHTSTRTRDRASRSGTRNLRLRLPAPARADTLSIIKGSRGRFPVDVSSQGRPPVNLSWLHCLAVRSVWKLQMLRRRGVRDFGCICCSVNVFASVFPPVAGGVDQASCSWLIMM